MATTRKIKTALVSVFHKDGLDALLKALHNEGVQFLSTGGTHDFIVSLGLPCQQVEDLTSYPSIRLSLDIGRQSEDTSPQSIRWYSWQTRFGRRP